MATTKDRALLQDIENNKKISVQLGNKTIKIRRLTNAVAERFDRYTAEAEMSYADGNLILNMSKNRKLVPKSVSLIILGTWLKVTLFHWIHWRILNAKYDTAELGEVLTGGLAMGEYQKFASVLLCLQDNSQMIARMSRGTIRTMMAEQTSEGATQSSSNSMAQ